MKSSNVELMYVYRWLTFALVGALVIYPLFWLVYGSLKGDSAAGGISFQAYIDVFNSPYFGDVVLSTLIMSIGTTVAAVLLGVPLAWIVMRTDTPLKPLLSLLALVPFITPPMLGAISWAYLGSPNSGALNLLWTALTGSEESLIDIYTMPGLIWVMSLYLTPYVFVFTSIALEHMDPALENAAYISGASPMRTTLTVTLPLMTPAIVSGALLVLIQSLEIFAIPAAIGSPGGIYVVVTEIYQTIQNLPPRYAEAAALSVPLLVVCAVALWLQTRALGKGKSFSTIGGKAFRSKLIALGRWRWLALAFALFYFVMAAVLPYLVFLYGSLIRSSGLAPVPENLTLSHFKEFFQGGNSGLIYRSIENSLILSIGGATIAVVLAALVAYFVNRGRWHGQRVLDFLSLVPVAIPGAVIAIGLLWAYIQPPFELYGTLAIILLAYITRCLPFGVRAVSTSIIQVSEELEKAARISGARWSVAFRTTLVPILLPGIFAGWVLMYVSMMRELSASIILFASDTETIAVALYLLWDEALLSQVSILALIIILLTLVPIALMRWASKSSGLKGMS